MDDVRAKRDFGRIVGGRSVRVCVRESEWEGEEVCVRVSERENACVREKGGGLVRLLMRE